MNLELLEPLRDLFKDEVRGLGRELDLPREMVGRHSRVRLRYAFGEVTREKVEILRAATTFLSKKFVMQDYTTGSGRPLPSSSRKDGWSDG